MTIARRRPRPVDAIAAPMPTVPSAPPPVPELPVPVPLGDAPAPEVATPAGRLRRCTFRRMDRVAALPAGRTDMDYEVMCLYGDAPLALGDLAAAEPICAACNASGIFRADED